MSFQKLTIIIIIEMYYDHLSQLLTMKSEADFSALFDHELFDLLNGL
jgi:hypothetical protein